MFNNMLRNVKVHRQKFVGFMKKHYLCLRHSKDSNIKDKNR